MRNWGNLQTKTTWTILVTCSVPPDFMQFMENSANPCEFRKTLQILVVNPWNEKRAFGEILRSVHYCPKEYLLMPFSILAFCKHTDIFYELSSCGVLSVPSGVNAQQVQ